ncbi:response regulator [Rhodonellum sp.]|uniref:response regulator n=1 Tax=Rhodonellum sp. TaxID=2231180 RepID=UPI00271F50C3|nr:response regulator [Rhodonellum sp.]MDO9552956.1 response regulator [Rhodonellum sp.]
MPTKPIVYIIDDDPGVVFLHEIIIQETKLTDHPESYTDAKKALDSILLNDRTDLKLLIFLDINMPKMNGWEFLNELNLKIKKADIKVVMVTSSLSRIDREKCKKYPIVIDFWEKPISEDQAILLQERYSDWFGTTS